MNQPSGILDATYAFQKKVFCIISDQRVFRSRSPAIFTRVFGRTGINGAYVPFMVEKDDIGKALESLRVLNIAGANITAPFKEKVLPYLDVLSEGANIARSARERRVWSTAATALVAKMVRLGI